MVKWCSLLTLLLLKASIKPVNVPNDKETVAINTAAITFRQYKIFFVKDLQSGNIGGRRRLGLCGLYGIFLLLYIFSLFFFMVSSDR